MTLALGGTVIELFAIEQSETHRRRKSKTWPKNNKGLFEVVPRNALPTKVLKTRQNLNRCQSRIIPKIRCGTEEGTESHAA